MVWDDAYLGYDFGEHPMHPVRLDLTIRLARELGVLDSVTLAAPTPADEATLLTAHSPDYLAALRAASVDPGFVGHGLGTEDNPVFPRMYEVGALIAGGSVRAAAQVWLGHADHGVNIAGGLHHAMRESASGFCLLNDVRRRHSLAAGQRRPDGWPTWTSTCTTATACRPRSGTTRAC